MDLSLSVLIIRLILYVKSVGSFAGIQFEMNEEWIYLRNVHISRDWRVDCVIRHMQIKLSVKRQIVNSLFDTNDIDSITSSENVLEWN